MLIGGIGLLSLAAAAIIAAACGAFESLQWLWVLPAGFAGCFLGTLLLLFLLLMVICATVDPGKPQEKDSKFFRLVAAACTSAVTSLLQTRLHVTGMEKMPESGRFLLVCNHLDILDPVILLHVFRKYQLAFISKRENQSMFLVGKLMHKLMCQMINRENDREALKTILKCIQLIREDQVSVAVFPEGYTSLDGLLHSFRSGVFKIAQKANVPIVVCTLQDTQHIFRRAAHLKPSAIELHLLEVIPAEQLKGVKAVDIGNRVHSLMAEDLGPDRVLQE